jgi:hypothetical protein
VHFRLLRARCGSALSAIFCLFTVLMSAGAQAGVVGAGTPASCTRAALAAQIAAGGMVTFSCGGVTSIAMDSTVFILANNPPTVIDGSGMITLDGASTPYPGNLFVISGTAGGPLTNITFRNIRLMNSVAGVNSVAGAAIQSSAIVKLDTVVVDDNVGRGIAQEQCFGCPAPMLTVNNSTFAVNIGGAIFLEGGTLNVMNSTFTANAAGAGGAILLSSNGTSVTSASITRNTFSGNSATDGGAIQVGPLNGGTATIGNNTFTSNQVIGPGPVTGSAIHMNAPTVLTNNTIAGNYSSFDPGGGALYFGVGAVTTMQDSLIVNNTGGNCAFASGVGFNGANNMQFGDASCTGVPVANPLLGPPVSNGGPTMTMALGPGSPAIDAGNNATCLATDQRGAPRADGNGDGGVVCDIGAFEFVAVAPLAAVVPTLDVGALLVLAALLAGSAALILHSRRVQAAA